MNWFYDFKTQMATLCSHSLPSCNLFFDTVVTSFFLFYFNDLKTLVGTVQGCCINDLEQLFLRIPVRHSDFRTKIFLITQINTFLLMPLQPWLIATKAKVYMVRFCWSVLLMCALFTLRDLGSNIYEMTQ